MKKHLGSVAGRRSSTRMPIAFNRAPHARLACVGPSASNPTLVVPRAECPRLVALGSQRAARRRRLQRRVVGFGASPPSTRSLGAVARRSASRVASNSRVSRSGSCENLMAIATLSMALSRRQASLLRVTPDRESPERTRSVLRQSRRQRDVLGVLLLLVEHAIDDVKCAVRVPGHPFVMGDDDCCGPPSVHLGSDELHHLLSELGVER